MGSAKEKSDQPKEAIAAYQQYVAASPNASLRGIAQLRIARLLADASQTDQALALLAEIQASPVAPRVQAQARLSAIRLALANERWDTARATLLDRPWELDAMPELSLLAFFAMQVGDQALKSESPQSALQAYRLVLPLSELVARQQARLSQLEQAYQQKRSRLAAAETLWDDLYRELIANTRAQLDALQGATDYSEALALRKASAYLKIGRPLEAYLLLERLSALEDSDLAEEAHLQWLNAARKLGAFPEALAIAQSFLETYPENESISRALYLFALAYLDQNRYLEAIDLLQRLLRSGKAGPLEPVARFQLGYSLASLHRYSEARQHFHACQQSGPSLLADQAALWIGLSHFFEQDYAASLAVFEGLRREALSPEMQGGATFRLAASHYALGDNRACEAALAAFFDAFPSHPREREAALLQGDNHLALGQHAQAIAAYQTIDAETPPLFCYATLGLAQAFSETGDAQAALLACQGAATPDLPSHLVGEIFLQWAALAETEDPMSLSSIFDSWIRKHGNGMQANLATEILSEAHRLVALDLSALQEQAEADDQTALAARALLTRALLKNPKREAAARETLLLQLASRYQPERMPAECLAHAGLALARMESTQGLPMLQQALALAPEGEHRPVACYGLALHYFHRQEYNAAMGWLAAIGEDAFDSPHYQDAMLLKGRIQLQASRLDEAQATFEGLLGARWVSAQSKAKALIGLGQIREARQETAPAIAYYQRAYALYPAFKDEAAFAYWRSAALFASLGDHETVRRTCQEFFRQPSYRISAHAQPMQDLLRQAETRLAQSLASDTQP